MPSVNAAELRLIKGSGDSRPHESHSMPAYVWKALVTSRSLWAIGCLYIFYSFAWSFFVSWLPKYLKEVHHVKFEDSEIRSGLPLFCGGVACLVGGMLSDAVVRRMGWGWLGRALFP